MATAAEITSQIDAIEAKPEYRKLLTSSRGPFENKTFQLYTLQLNTLRLRRDDLTKREQPLGPSPTKAASPLVLPTDKKRMDVLTQPNKAIPDPAPERKALFPAKTRSAHLQAPNGPKIHGVTGAPQQGLVVIPGSNLLPPPADTSMPLARKSPNYQMPEPAPPTPPSTDSLVSVSAETGKLTKTPNALAPTATMSVAKTPPAGRVAPAGNSEVEPQLIVGKPKGLVSLATVNPAGTQGKAAASPVKKDDPERAAARKALTTEVETIDFLDSMDLNIGDGIDEDNIVNELAAIDDIDNIGLETEMESKPEPIVEVPKVKKAAAKKAAGKKAAAKK